MVERDKPAALADATAMADNDIMALPMTEKEASETMMCLILQL